MAMQKATIGAVSVIAVMAVIMSAFSALMVSRTISNTGNVRAVGVGIYSDSNCTVSISSISWGALDAGATTSVTIYVKNEGNVAVRLSMTVSNWSPAGTSSYLTLAWNREGTTLNAGSSIQAVLTLSVSSSISGITNFSFDITIAGTQV